MVKRANAGYHNVFVSIFHCKKLGIVWKKLKGLGLMSSGLAVQVLISFGKALQTGEGGVGDGGEVGNRE